MPVRFAFAAICVVIVALAGGGCSSSQSIATWQKSIERYVAERGDPNALRDVTLSSGRRGFAVIGGANPKKSTDAKGLLLGHNTIDNRPWYIYLVGVVREQKVDDIHLAAVSFADGKPTSALSSNDAKATTLYRNHNEGLWKSQHPQEKPPAEYTTFPRDADSFELSVTDSKAQAKHAPSGAAWLVDVAQKPQQRR